jgi:phosphopantetheine adenylyltransferase
MDSAEAPSYLLLLPPVSEPYTSAVLREKYGKTIAEVLKEVASHSEESPEAAVLEIAVACEHLVGAHDVPRAQLYDQTQALVAGLYRLVCVLAAEDNINVEDQDGVDVRLLLVAWSAKNPAKSAVSHTYGPIISLDVLARSERPWRFAFGEESQEGETIVRAFVEAKQHVHSSTELPRDSAKPTTESFRSRHRHVAVGGTFDHLHIGHKLLLTMTLFAVDQDSNDQASSATIGITGDQLLVKKKHANLVESWADRQRVVAKFLSALTDFSPLSAQVRPRINVKWSESGPNGKSVDVRYASGLTLKHTEIQDPFGPTITDEQISALVISAETRSGGNAVNEKREARGWSMLEVFEVDVLDGPAESDSGNNGVKTDFENKLSSSAIREKLARKSQGKI